MLYHVTLVWLSLVLLKAAWLDLLLCMCQLLPAFSHFYLTKIWFALWRDYHVVGILAYLVRDHSLYSVLNAATRVIFHLLSANHITDVLTTLRWLHILKRIEYKITLMTFRALEAFPTSSSDTDCILTFISGLFVPALRWFCHLRSAVWYDKLLICTSRVTSGLAKQMISVSDW